MKKILCILCSVFIISTLSGCFKFWEPVSTTRPMPKQPDKTGYTDTASPDELENPDDVDPDETSEVTVKTPEEDRTEITNMIRDAKDLIDAGLRDDANKLLSALRSRNLTTDEKKQVDTLQSKMITISD